MNERPNDWVGMWTKRCGEVEGGTSGVCLAKIATTEKAKGGTRRKSQNFEDLLRKFDPEVTGGTKNCEGAENYDIWPEQTPGGSMTMKPTLEGGTSRKIITGGEEENLIIQPKYTPGGVMTMKPTDR